MASVHADEIMALERTYWDAMRSGDGEAGARLTAPECIVAGASGTGLITPAILSQMLATATWRLIEYAIDDPQFLDVDADTSIVAYRVHEELTVDGAPVALDAFETSVWRREAESWRCVLHTESLAGDPFGRDRRAAP
ncbi:MAG: nuclear transport factor 2 family protein [Dehalococcoidia bacterium]